MNVDYAALREITKTAYVPVVTGVFGEPGGTAIRILMQTLHDLYGFVEPSRCQGRITLFSEIEDGSLGLNGERIRSFAELQPRVVDGFVLSISKAGEARLVETLAGVSSDDISTQAVVYIYEGGVEHFGAGQIWTKVDRVVPSSPSAFAIPSFAELEEALTHYAQAHVRTSQCGVFNQVWRDPQRLLLKNRPEATMRKSLTQYLKSVLRNAEEVRPEQNVDETHPVDIKVTFSSSNRIALIEIKWIGRSVGPSGEDVSYAGARAREGAQQLVNYLDSNHDQIPYMVSQGILVVFDARRRNVRPDSQIISKADGMHFATREITYAPKFHEIKEDFSQPFRMFAEPIWTEL